MAVGRAVAVKMEHSIVQLEIAARCSRKGLLPFCLGFARLYSFLGHRVRLGLLVLLRL